MIITVTMNPAIDATLIIDKLAVGGMNRIQRTETVAAGKGINVSKDLIKFGEQSIAMGFLAGGTGEFIENQLKNMGITTEFVRVFGDTRTNTKVVESDGTVTELNEKGPMVSEDQFQQLITKLTNACNENTYVIVSGSAPVGVRDDAYRIITRKVHEKGGKVFVDAQGKLLAQALIEKPDFIKPNLDELKEHFGIEGFMTMDDIIACGQKIVEQGVDHVIVSIGNQGALFFEGGSVYQAMPLDVKVVNTIGAGDSMVAAIVYSHKQNLDFVSAMKFCTAVSNAAVTVETSDKLDMSVVHSLIPQVEIRKLR